MINYGKLYHEKYVDLMNQIDPEDKNINYRILPDDIDDPGKLDGVFITQQYKMIVIRISNGCLIMIFSQTL